MGKDEQIKSCLLSWNLVRDNRHGFPMWLLLSRRIIAFKLYFSSYKRVLPIGKGLCILCIFVSVYNISILGGLGVCDSHFLVMSSMCLTRYIWSMILLTLACVLFTIGALRGL